MDPGGDCWAGFGSTTLTGVNGNTGLNWPDGKATMCLSPTQHSVELVTEAKEKGEKNPQPFNLLLVFLKQ